MRETHYITNHKGGTRKTIDESDVITKKSKNKFIPTYYVEQVHSIMVAMQVIATLVVPDGLKTFR